MGKYILILLFICSFVSTYAQSDFEQYVKQQRKEFSDYSQKQKQDFNAYRDKVNAEFADFMRKSWDEFHSTPAVPAPQSPDPVLPPTVDPKKPPTIDPIPFKKIVPIAAPITPPQPVVPIPQPVQPVKDAFRFLFYDTECSVHLGAGQQVRLADLSESDVADAWGKFADTHYNPLISDCLQLRDQLKLCDWAYLQLLKTLSEKYYQSTTSNEAVLLQMYLLTQSGYKVRIAKSGNRLTLLLPSNQTLYGYSYINIEGVKYYILDKSLKDSQFAIFNHAFPKEQIFSLQMRELPDFSFSATAPKTMASVRYPEIKMQVTVNQNLIDFYNSYPVSDYWNWYAGASLSENVKQTVYPVLQRAIAGKSQAEAANILINFVQKSFKYQTDNEQFGYERPFFADENFYYPYNDCEDRSILYSILVKDLLDLEVVLLHYPMHLATAVRFTDNISGDYLMIDGKKFLVCDPTYIGADIGMAMDDCKHIQAIVVKI